MCCKVVFCVCVLFASFWFLVALKNIFIAYLCSGFWAWHESYRLVYVFVRSCCPVVLLSSCPLAGFQCSNNCDCVNLNVSQVIFLHTTDARSSSWSRRTNQGRGIPGCRTEPSTSRSVESPCPRLSFGTCLLCIVRHWRVYVWVCVCVYMCGLGAWPAGVG